MDYYDLDVFRQVLNVLASLINVALSGTIKLREPETYGDVTLSVQASEWHYCEPCVTGLPLEEYRSVEVALFVGGNIVRPEQVGLDEFKALFEDGPKPVARYVSQEDVDRMRKALASRALQIELHKAGF